MSELLVTTHQHKRLMATGVQLASHARAHKNETSGHDFQKQQPPYHLTSIDIYGWLLNKLWPADLKISR